MLKMNGIPQVKYHDKEYDANKGEGAEIPVIIGKTGTPVTEIKIEKYESLQDANKPASEGGIIGSTENNPLLFFLRDFLARE